MYTGGGGPCCSYKLQTSLLFPFSLLSKELNSKEHVLGKKIQYLRVIKEQSDTGFIDAPFYTPWLTSERPVVSAIHLALLLWTGQG